MSPKPLPLPDLDDEEFTARLRSLEAATVPQSGLPVHRMATAPDVGDPAYPEASQSGRSDVAPAGQPAVRNAGGPNQERHVEWPERRTGTHPESRTSGVLAAAERLAEIERIRGPKRRFEYLIPARVGDALAEDAARQGKSATLRLLEVLRNAGYPVIEEDLMDLRKERRR